MNPDDQLPEKPNPLALGLPITYEDLPEPNVQVTIAEIVSRETKESE